MVGMIRTLTTMSTLKTRSKSNQMIKKIYHKSSKNKSPTAKQKMTMTMLMLMTTRMTITSSQIKSKTSRLKQTRLKSGRSRCLTLPRLSST